MKIKIKYHNQNCKIESFGNWIDLKSAEKVVMHFGEHKYISLGVSMELPKYYQGNLVPRSSTYAKFGLIQANHYGVVDGPTNVSQGYSGNNDIWKFSAICLKETIYATIQPKLIEEKKENGEINITNFTTEKCTVVNEGDRLCQFEVKLAMSAPWWAKLKWLFDGKVEFIEVDDLKAKDRGGYGSTNV